MRAAKQSWDHTSANDTLTQPTCLCHTTRPTAQVYVLNSSAAHDTIADALDALDIAHDDDEPAETTRMYTLQATVNALMDKFKDVTIHTGIVPLAEVLLPQSFARHFRTFGTDTGDRNAGKEPFSDADLDDETLNWVAPRSTTTAREYLKAGQEANRKFRDRNNDMSSGSSTASPSSSQEY